LEVENLVVVDNIVAVVGNMVVEFDDIGVVGNTVVVETDDSFVVETDNIVVVKVLAHGDWYSFAGQFRLIELLILYFHFLIILDFRLL
jgi:hypothetical protein